MNTVKYILGLPEYIEGIGNIYPVKVKDYDVFMENADILMYNRQHFLIEGNYPLLDLVIAGLPDREKTISKLETIFNLVLNQKVYFVVDGMQYGFIIDEEHIIDNSNYDIIRQVIMKQNLLFEPKVYKDKITQEWANKVLEARAKQGLKITIEDKITTVATFKGLTYDQIAEETIYQLEADFIRISKIISHNTTAEIASGQIAIAGKPNIEINNFAESIDMFQSPWDSIFVSKDKLKKLNDIFKEK